AHVMTTTRARQVLTSRCTIDRSRRRLGGGRWRRSRCRRNYRHRLDHVIRAYLHSSGQQSVEPTFVQTGRFLTVVPADDVMGVQDKDMADRTGLARLYIDEAQLLKQIDPALPCVVCRLAAEASRMRHFLGLANVDHRIIPGLAPQAEIGRGQWL